jgi:cation diffusion facilitator CzcD-associated flavoprotein CzcO
VKKISAAIIGAGPYGLSLAAHLAPRCRDCAVFGRTMDTWRNHMPAGMHLKSDGFASSLYDPEGEFPLREFCRSNAIPYADIGTPVGLETFIAYGREFQRRFVPQIDEKLVTHAIKDGTGFRLTLEDGEHIWTKFVVVAAGISHFGVLPEMLAAMPPQFVSHSSRHHSFDQYAGQNIVVLGAGASAVDVALALHEAGAHPQLVTRRKEVPFHGKAPDKRSLTTRIRNPWSGLGPGWPSRLACDLPLVFHAMPKDFRLKVVKKHLGPAPGWFTRDRIFKNIPMQTGLELVRAEVLDSKVHLEFRQQDGENRTIEADHVIAGTGYRVDLRRLGFLDESMCQSLAMEETSPVLSTNFESSIPGLYFVGSCAAFSFGPLLRFAFGAHFTSRRLSRHLAKKVRSGLQQKGDASLRVPSARVQKVDLS